MGPSAARANQPSSVRRAISIGLVALTTLTGCDQATGGRAGDAGGPVILESNAVHVFGTSESIAVVEDLEVLTDGTVWVLNSVEPFFIGFGSDGNVVHEHGSRGGGPEEFRAPVGFVSGGVDGDAWVLDAIRHALIRISDPEGPWSEILIPRDSLPPGSIMSGQGFMSNRVRTARMGDEIVLPRGSGSIQTGIFAWFLSVWGADLIAVDGETASARTVVSLGGAMGDPTEYLEQTNGFPPFPVWRRLWAVCSDSEVRFHDRFRNQVRVFASAGTELDPIPLPPPHFSEVTNQQFARAVFALSFAEAAGQVGAEGSAADTSRVFNEMIQGVEGDPDQLAGFLPRYVDMRCDDDGAVWMQPVDLDLWDMAGSSTWLRISPDGVTQEVELPARFDPYRFT